MIIATLTCGDVGLEIIRLHHERGVCFGASQVGMMVQRQYDIAPLQIGFDAMVVVHLGTLSIRCKLSHACPYFSRLGFIDFACTHVHFD